jgi:excisionase family DNA binding protein
MRTTKPLMSPTDLADLFGVPVSTIYQWKYRGIGPTPYRIGKHLRYKSEEVQAWIEAQADPAHAGV